MDFVESEGNLLLIGMFAQLTLPKVTTGQEWRDFQRATACRDRNYNVRTVDDKHKGNTTHLQANVCISDLVTAIRNKWPDITFFDHICIDWYNSPVSKFIIHILL